MLTPRLDQILNAKCDEAKGRGHFRSIFFSSSLSTSMVVHVRKADSAPYNDHFSTYSIDDMVLNFRLLQKHGQEYQLTSLISTSTAQFRVVRFLFTSECRYVKQTLLPFSNQKAKQLAVFRTSRHCH